MNPATVYVSEREGGAGFDISWLDGKEPRSVFRRNKGVAAAYAKQKQAQFDKKTEAGASMPFGDTVQVMDGTTGAPWLELIWAAALQVSNNPAPGPRGLESAARTVALLAQAARKMLTADKLGDELPEDTDDPAFWGHVVTFLEKAPAETKTMVLKVLQGGKA